jgi:ribosomal protein S11
MAKGKWTNNDMQKKYYYMENKRTNNTILTITKTGGEFMCSGWNGK